MSQVPKYSLKARAFSLPILGASQPQASLSSQQRYYKKNIYHRGYFPVSFCQVELVLALFHRWPVPWACALFLLLSADLPSLLHNRQIFYLSGTLSQRQCRFLALKARACFSYGLNCARKLPSSSSICILWSERVITWLLRGDV